MNGISIAAQTKKQAFRSTEARMPQIFYLFIDYPALILGPIAVLVALSVWSASRTAWLATAAWVLYFAYELGMKYRILCDLCIKRSEMYVVYPLLLLLTLVAAVQIYVHLRRQMAGSAR